MAADAQPSSQEIGIKELSEMVDRRAQTIRKWERENELPQSLRASRNKSNRRGWTPEQVVGILQWLRNRHPGSAFPWYHPSREERTAHIHHMRST
jgi:hypothetical protein